ncbi:unnamed protein product [Amoebophrya sp. A120]|nr:unnamed protein product [Amoebophrya sp. A120]|eukprot:GSA120T00003268001.1
MEGQVQNFLLHRVGSTTSRATNNQDLLNGSSSGGARMMNFTKSPDSNRDGATPKSTAEGGTAASGLRNWLSNTAQAAASLSPVRTLMGGRAADNSSSTADSRTPPFNQPNKAGRSLSGSSLVPPIVGFPPPQGNGSNPTQQVFAAASDEDEGEDADLVLDEAATVVSSSVTPSNRLPGSKSGVASTLLSAASKAVNLTSAAMHQSISSTTSGIRTPSETGTPVAAGGSHGPRHMYYLEPPSSEVDKQVFPDLMTVSTVSVLDTSTTEPDLASTPDVVAPAAVRHSEMDRGNINVEGAAAHHQQHRFKNRQERTRTSSLRRDVENKPSLALVLPEEESANRWFKCAQARATNLLHCLQRFIRALAFADAISGFYNDDEEMSNPNSYSSNHAPPVVVQLGNRRARNNFYDGPPGSRSYGNYYSNPKQHEITQSADSLWAFCLATRGVMRAFQIYGCVLSSAEMECCRSHFEELRGLADTRSSFGGEDAHQQRTQQGGHQRAIASQSVARSAVTTVSAPSSKNTTRGADHCATFRPYQNTVKVIQRAADQCGSVFKLLAERVNSSAQESDEQVHAYNSSVVNAAPYHDGSIYSLTSQHTDTTQHQVTASGRTSSKEMVLQSLRFVVGRMEKISATCKSFDFSTAEKNLHMDRDVEGLLRFDGRSRSAEQALPYSFLDHCFVEDQICASKLSSTDGKGHDDNSTSGVGATTSLAWQQEGPPRSNPSTICSTSSGSASSFQEMQKRTKSRSVNAFQRELRRLGVAVPLSTGNKNNSQTAGSETSMNVTDLSGESGMFNQSVLSTSSAGTTTTNTASDQHPSANNSSNIRSWSDMRRELNAKRNLEIELDNARTQASNLKAEVARLQEELSESRTVFSTITPAARGFLPPPRPPAPADRSSDGTANDNPEDNDKSAGEQARPSAASARNPSAASPSSRTKSSSSVQSSDDEMLIGPGGERISLRKMQDQLSNRELLVEQLEGAIAWADKRTEDLQKVAQRYYGQIQDLSDERETMREIIERKVGELEELKSRDQETKKSYEEQISVLSEHLCSMDVKFSQQAGRIERARIRCGNCGTWNSLDLSGDKTCTKCRSILLKLG